MHSRQTIHKLWYKWVNLKLHGNIEVIYMKLLKQDWDIGLVQILQKVVGLSAFTSINFSEMCSCGTVFSFSLPGWHLGRKWRHWTGTFQNKIAPLCLSHFLINSHHMNFMAAFQFHFPRNLKLYFGPITIGLI